MEPELNWRDYIGSVPGVRSGKMTIKGTRITVADVLGWLSSGMRHEEIFQDFPEIKPEHIRAVLSYAYYRENIGMQIAS